MTTPVRDVCKNARTFVAHGEHDPDPERSRCRRCGELSTPYDAYADAYVQLLRGPRAGHVDETVALVRQLLGVPRAGADEFVDLACGPGLITANLAAYGWRVLGVDASRPFVEMARRQLPLDQVLHADAAETTLPSGGFAAVVSTYPTRTSRPGPHSSPRRGAWPAPGARSCTSAPIRRSSARMPSAGIRSSGCMEASTRPTGDGSMVQD